MNLFTALLILAVIGIAAVIILIAWMLDTMIYSDWDDQ